MKVTRNAWLICAGCTILMFSLEGLLSNAFSVYLPYLNEALHLTGAQTSALLMVRILFALAMTPFAESFCRRLGFRLAMTAAAALGAGAFFLFSSMQSFGLCCLAAAVAGLATGLGGLIPVSLLIVHTFTQRRGSALGVCTAASGVAAIVAPPLIQQLIAACDLSRAFLYEGLFVILCGLLVFLLVHPAKWTPQDGETSEKPSGAILFPRGSLCVVLSALLLGLLGDPSFSHLSMLYGETDLSAAQNAILLSAAGLSLTLGKLVYGRLADKVGTGRATLMMFLLQTGGMLLCCLNRLGFVFALAEVLVLGMGLSLATTGLTLLAADLAEPGEYGALLRIMQIMFMGGGLLFSSAPGIVADLTGSYVPAYLCMAVFSAVSMALVWYAYRKKRPIRPKHDA